MSLPLPSGASWIECRLIDSEKQPRARRIMGCQIPQCPDRKAISWHPGSPPEVRQVTPQVSVCANGFRPLNLADVRCQATGNPRLILRRGRAT